MIDKTTLSEIYRLKNLIRYNNRTRLKDESVAEHSYYVALISLMICDKLDVTDEIKSKCVIRSLLHDLPEIEINDITHDAKRRMNLSEQLKKFEDNYYEQYFPKYFDLMQEKGLVEAIVSLADAESVLQFIQNEISLGNTSVDIIEVENEILARLRLLNQQVRELKEKL